MKNFKFISQKNQDDWIIKEIFNFKKNGFFVDLAASDGVSINNTFLLEKYLDWNGICIEPLPRHYNELKKNRKCILVNECVDSTTHTVEFISNKGVRGLANGILDTDMDNNYKIRGGLIKQAFNKNTVIKMKTKTLEEILDENNAPKIIDYLSLDVEGAETRIMENFPFTRYKFLSMTIERPTPKLNKLLFENGYLFVRNSNTMKKKVPFDTFYIHKSLDSPDIKKFPFKQVPKKNW